MNDWNQLENLLHSWKPRRPSADLDTRIFSRSEPVQRIGIATVLLPCRRIAAALVCVLFAMASLTPRAPHMGYLGLSDTAGLYETLTNQSLSAYLVAGFHSRQNSIQGEFFESTKAHRIPSSNDSFSSMKTNSLVH